MYKIINVSDKKRFCEDKLLEPKESMETDKEMYVFSARLSPHIFEVKIVKQKKSKEADK